MKRKRPLVKRLLRKSSGPKGWTEDLWKGVFRSSTFKLIVDRYRFLSKTSDTTRVLGEPGDVSFASKSHGFRSISLITREYFGRLGHLDESHPASTMRVRLSWNTDRLMIGAQEWWHWGTATVPSKGVYGMVTPIELSEPYASPVSLSITLGTDNAGEALFEELFLRSKDFGSGPVVIYGRIKTLPMQDTRIGLVSEYSIEQSVG